MFKISTSGRKYLRTWLISSALLFSMGGAHAVTYSTLHSFAGGRRGAYPSGKLLIDSSGDLFGTTVAGTRGGVVYELLASKREKVLFDFFNRAEANSGLVTDSAGNLYGTTQQGGGGTNCKRGCGTVYKLAPNGTETILHAFQGGSNDGAVPSGGLVADASGNLYGTTQIGGIGDKIYCGSRGCGTVYKVAPDGTETVLHFFQPETNDGILPRAGLIFDSVGNLYGTTTEAAASVLELEPFLSCRQIIPKRSCTPFNGFITGTRMADFPTVNW